MNRLLIAFLILLSAKSCFSQAGTKSEIYKLYNTNTGQYYLFDSAEYKRLKANTNNSYNTNQSSNLPWRNNTGNTNQGSNLSWRNNNNGNNYSGGATTGSYGATTSSSSASTGSWNLSTGQDGASTGSYNSYTGSVNATTGYSNATTGSRNLSTGSISTTSNANDANTGQTNSSTGSSQANTNDRGIAYTGLQSATTGSVNSNTGNNYAITGKNSFTGNTTAKTGIISTAKKNVNSDGTINNQSQNKTKSPNKGIEFGIWENLLKQTNDAIDRGDNKTAFLGIVSLMGYKAAEFALYEAGGYAIKGVGSIIKYERAVEVLNPSMRRLAADEASKLAFQESKTYYIKPLGLGSTSKINYEAYTTYEKSILDKVALSPQNGVIIKSINMRDSRWAAAEGWTKMTQYIDGVEVHYVGKWKNGILIAVDDYKVIRK